jgi:23S rRNA (uracil1939-C5)-methyltransferase
MAKPLQLEIEAMAKGGYGLARERGRSIYVPYTIPGELIAARIVRTDERASYAEGTELLDASADRVYPRCQHFGPGRCWRCQWQHIDYSAQLLIKQDVLAEHLERLGGVRDDVVQPLVASPAPYGYAYHMTFSPLPAGGFALPNVDEQLVPIQVCHLLHPDLLDLYQQLDMTLPNLKRLKLQMGSDGDQMVILYMAEEDAPELETDLDASINLLLPDNEPMNLVGESHVRYRVHDRMFRVTAGSYYRANAQLVPALVDTVLRLLSPQADEYILDLYAGVGVFGAFIARHAKLVTLVESYPPAATDAEANLADLDNVDVIEGTVEEALGALDGTYDAAVVDPSAALSEDALTSLVEMTVKRVIYVSGDSATLARDCKRLAKRGYLLQHVQPFDFAPQTYHIESVALFSRNG